MPHLAPIEATPHIGPIYVHKKNKERDKYPHELTESCALTDRVFQDTTVKGAPYLYENPLEVLRAPEPKDVIDAYQEMIQEHVERRIQFFFQQLIICYQTKLHFRTDVGTSEQAVSASSLVLKIDNEQKPLCQRHAAHSSTAPFLIAYDLKEWEGKGAQATGFVFLKGTDYYRTQQATMNMSRWINDADSAIDYQTGGSLLRKKAEKLLNQASQGEITPDEGIGEFVKEALIETEKAIRKAAPAVARALELYQVGFLHFQEQVQNDPAFLEKFLNVQFKSAQDKESKRVILQMRYAAIRKTQVDQSKLIQKVEAVKKEILQTVAKPTFFEAAFRTLLIESATTPQDRQRLEKLYNFSPEQFLTQYRKADITKFNNAKEALKPQAKKIQSVAKEILNDMRHLRTEEEGLRAQVTQELRCMKGWSQKQLGEKIRTLFRHAACSQSTLSRIENRKKLVTPQIAEELSQVFDVDAGLFMPHFFYE